MSVDFPLFGAAEPPAAPARRPARPRPAAGYAPRPPIAAAAPIAGPAPCTPAAPHKKTREKRQAPVPTHARHSISEPTLRGSGAQLPADLAWPGEAGDCLPDPAGDSLQAAPDFPEAPGEGNAACDAGCPEAGTGMQSATLDASATPDSYATLESGLAELGGNDGIFELLLPGGESVGVVVNADSRRTSFLLQASETQLGEHLRQNRLELERGLQRRMQANVEIAVL